MTEIIAQEKSDEELIAISDNIVDLLKECNLAEKYKILSVLLDTFTACIKEKGIIFTQEGGTE